MVWPTGGTAESGEGKAAGCLPAPPAPCFLQSPQRQPCWSLAPPPLGGPLPGSVTDPLLPAVTRRPAVLPVSGGFSDPHLSLASIPSTALSLVERPGESSGRQRPQSPGSLSHSSGRAVTIQGCSQPETLPAKALPGAQIAPYARGCKLAAPSLPNGAEASRAGRRRPGPSAHPAPSYP